MAVPKTFCCKYCRAPIHWEVSPSGKRYPAEADGRNHWATCKAAQEEKARKAAEARATAAAARDEREPALPGIVG